MARSVGNGASVTSKGMRILLPQSDMTWGFILGMLFMLLIIGAVWLGWEMSYRG